MDRTLFGLPDPGGSYAAGQLAGWPDSPSTGGGIGGILNNLGPKWGQLSSIFSGGGDPWQGMMKAAASGGVPSAAEAFQDILGYAARQGAPSTAAPAAPAAPAAMGAPSVDASTPLPAAPAALGASSTARPDLRRAMMAGQPLRAAFGGWGRA